MCPDAISSADPIDHTMMYLPHFTSFKKGTKLSISLDQPAVIAARGVGRSIITNDNDDVVSLFKL